MDLKTLRDDLIANRALAKKNQETIINARGQILNMINNMSAEDVEMLRSRGLDIDSVINIDTDKFITDREYLANYKKTLTTFLINLKNSIEVNLR